MVCVEGAGSWSKQPVLIGAKDFAIAGAPIAVSRRYGAKDQTDVFLVDKNGTLNLFWVEGAGVWNGPKSIGPPGLAPSAGPSSKGAFVVASQQLGTKDRDQRVHPQ